MKQQSKKYVIKYIVLMIVLFYLLGYLKKRYFNFIPTIPIYPNNEKEIKDVENLVDEKNIYYINLFKKTDISPCKAFEEIIEYKCDKINNIISKPHIIFGIFFLKILFNRARPKQINYNLNVYESSTANTPAFPSGHCIQSIYLAKVLSLKFPEKKEQLMILAKDIALSRVYAGLHFPSDNLFGEKIADFLFNFY